MLFQIEVGHSIHKILSECLKLTFIEFVTQLFAVVIKVLHVRFAT